MTRPLIILMTCLAGLIVAGCAKQNRNAIYVLVGTGSPDFDLAIEGSTSQFMVTGPGKEDSYGEISIRSDGTEKGMFRWGGSVCQVGTATNPPNEIQFEGTTKEVLFYGVAEMDPETGDGVLLKRKDPTGGIHPYTQLQRTHHCTSVRRRKMKCPKCLNELEPGMAEIQGSFVGLILIGLSHQTLKFRPREGDEKRLLRPYDAVVAYRCETCDLTVLDHRLGK